MRNLKATAEKQMTVGQAYDAQVSELADMISSVFLVHHGSNLQTFKSLDVGLVLTAAEASLAAFFSDVEKYIKGTFDLVTNLPSELAGLPADIANAAAPENQPDATQLTNVTYLMQAFNQLVSDLEDPIAVSGSGSVFSYAPCFVSIAPGGVQVGATGVNIGPALAVITPEGVNIQPQGLNIQPVLITIFPVGVNVQPQGLNIAPALIAVTPGRVSINPQGGSIGPALISVSAAQP